MIQWKTVTLPAVDWLLTWSRWVVHLSPRYGHTGQGIPCSDSCILTIIWFSIRKVNQGEASCLGHVGGLCPSCTRPYMKKWMYCLALCLWSSALRPFGQPELRYKFFGPEISIVLEDSLNHCYFDFFSRRISQCTKANSNNNDNLGSSVMLLRPLPPPPLLSNISNLKFPHNQCLSIMI